MQDKPGPIQVDHVPPFLTHGDTPPKEIIYSQGDRSVRVVYHSPAPQLPPTVVYTEPSPVREKRSRPSAGDELRMLAGACMAVLLFMGFSTFVVALGALVDSYSQPQEVQRGR